MADDPKKKEEEKTTLLVEVVALLVFLYFLGILWRRADEFFTYYYGTGFSSIGKTFVTDFYTHIVPTVRIVGFVAGALAIWGIVHASLKLSVIKKEEKALYGAKSRTEDEAVPAMKNERWERIISHANSANSSDWRLAIIEADIMLDDLLKTLGYHGDTLGERLKAVEKSDMLSLDNAWEAHRVRNQIAHQGGEYPLAEREAKRAIAMYESVLKEFSII